MKPMESFIKLIRDLHVLDINTSAEMDQRILHDSLKVQQEFKQTKLAETQPDIRNIIMKNPITKYAAVFAIVIATGAIATTVGLKVRKYYFVGKESDGTYVFSTEPETVDVGDGQIEVSNREYRTGGYMADGKADPNYTIDVEQKKKDFEEIDLLRQRDARELVRVTEKEVNGKPQRRSFGFKYVLEDGREIKIGESDPDTEDRERSLTDAQRDELLQLRLAQKGKDLPSQEKEVKGIVFSFKRKHFVLSDGTEVIVSVGRPK